MVRTSRISMRDIIKVMLAVDCQAYSFELAMSATSTNGESGKT